MKTKLTLAILLVCVQLEQASADNKFIYSVGKTEIGRWETIGDPSQDALIPFTADINADGNTDIIFTGITYPWVEGGPRGPQFGLVLFNNGDNTFTLAEGESPGSEAARKILSEDFNGDDILDIYIADHGFDADPFPGFKNQLMLGTGNGFTDASDRLPNIEAFTHGAAAADIDGDGDLDILSLNSDDLAEELSYFLINDGAANFTLNRQRLPATLSDTTMLQSSFSAELADFDGDSFPDLLIGRSVGPTRIHWNDGNGFFTDADQTQLEDTDIWGNGLDGLSVIGTKAVDVNGDNLNDVLLTVTNQGTFTGINMELLINQGDRVFKDETIARLTSLARDTDPGRQLASFHEFVDINGDGIEDIVTVQSGDTSDNGIVLYEGTGNGCFEPVTHSDLTDDPDTRSLIKWLPLFSADAVGFANWYNAIDGNGDRLIGLRYVPLNIQPVAPVANHFNGCRGKIEANLEFDGVVYSLDFSIFSTSPDVVIQADQSSASVVTESIENVATFTSSNGLLVLPELVLDGVVAYRNLQFQLTDGAQLLFSLISID